MNTSSRFLRQAEGGMLVGERCRALGMNNASFYKWRATYGGMEASLLSQMKAMEDEHSGLKRMYANLSLQADSLKEALGKVMGPSQRREMAVTAVARRGASIGLACRASGSARPAVAMAEAARR